MGLTSRITSVLGLAALLLSACSAPKDGAPARQWLAGDHHIHSEWSVGWDREQDPPAPIRGGDAIYAISKNAEEAKKYGLSWMVATDHGGPNHSKVNRDQAYPELLKARDAFPEMVIFWGMEFDSHAADHASLIIPHTHDEADVLYQLESGYARRDPHPENPVYDTEPHMIDALETMRDLDEPPVVIANHPSRSAQPDGTYGRYDPAEFRNWNDTAPNVAVGMAGAPGHQAVTVKVYGLNATGHRGGYRQQATMGGFDQMTARVGGFWDSMLGEGRRWWITANSDSHVNWRDGGNDFWPGEYSKTFVFAEKTHDDILNGIRNGRVFVTLGDLISGLYLTLSAGEATASIGGTLPLANEEGVTLSLKVDPAQSPNANGDTPKVQRVDVIMGQITGPAPSRDHDHNHTARVLHRFDADDWQVEDGRLVMTLDLPPSDHDYYIRVRGTNTAQLEPDIDPIGEDPWSDLWFYSNPIFVERVRP